MLPQSMALDTRQAINAHKTTYASSHCMWTCRGCGYKGQCQCSYHLARPDVVECDVSLVASLISHCDGLLAHGLACPGGLQLTTGDTHTHTTQQQWSGQVTLSPQPQLPSLPQATCHPCSHHPSDSEPCWCCAVSRIPRPCSLPFNPLHESWHTHILLPLMNEGLTLQRV